MKDLAFSTQLFSLNDIQDINSSTIVLNFYKAAIINSLSVVLWRSPEDKQIYSIISFSEKVKPLRINFSNNQSGFAFSPFRNDTGNSTLFVNSHLF